MPDPVNFRAVTVLKRDAFSETVMGEAIDDPSRKLVLRRLEGLAQPGRAIGRFLAAREARALRAVADVPGTPRLLGFDKAGLLRGWLEGTPLHLARPTDPDFYRDAARLLRSVHRCGVTHNDLAKPQNWLMTEDGRAAVIDFQIASVSKGRGPLFRLRAYEDLRHLLKNKRRYVPDQLTARERRIVERRSLPGRLWRAIAKPIYNFVTRKVMNWSDNEGASNTLDVDLSALRNAFLADDRVTAVDIRPFPRAGGDQGLYAFIETTATVDDIRRRVPARQIELVQAVTRLPRDEEGGVRTDLLGLVAANRLDELSQLSRDRPPVTGDMAAIVAARLNLTDRY